MHFLFYPNALGNSTISKLINKRGVLSFKAKNMKKTFKWLAIILLSLAVLGYIAIKVMSKPIPPVINEDGDALAEQMLTNLNKEAWDTLQYLSFEFMGGHKYIYAKQANKAIISWDDYRVYLDLDQIDGIVYQNDIQLDEKEAKDVIQKAWSFWCNDSFWMFAPYKVFDPGTDRSVVETDEGESALLISYSSGGVTPGDQYMWILDKNYRPVGYRMWVSILPIRGLFVSWEEWTTVEGGAVLSQFHKNDFFSFRMEGVKAFDDPTDVGLPADAFEF